MAAWKSEPDMARITRNIARLASEAPPLREMNRPARSGPMAFPAPI